MKRLLLPALLLLAAPPARLHAHDHIEVGYDPTDSTRLALAGPSYQLMLYVPLGEPFSGYLPQFPGGVYPSELTFATDGNVLDFAFRALPRIECVSVAGPAEGEFSFWEVGATLPTWMRPVGWTASDGDRPSLVVYEDNTGYGHIHGRAFSVTRPGSYTVVFRAIDDSGTLLPSASFTVTFNAVLTPPLTPTVTDGTVHLSFTSRPGLTYDLESSTTLADDSWQVITTVDGTGKGIELEDPMAERPRVFYRLVEYR